MCLRLLLYEGGKKTSKLTKKSLPRLTWTSASNESGLDLPNYNIKSCERCKKSFTNLEEIRSRKKSKHLFSLGLDGIECFQCNNERSSGEPASKLSISRLFKRPCLSKLLLVCKSLNLIDLRHCNEKRTKNGPLPEEH